MNPFRKSESSRPGVLQQIQNFFDSIGPSPVRALRAAIANYDEPKAIQIYQQRHRNGVCLQQDMHPSLPFPGADNGDTPLHLASLAAMKDLLLLFLDRGGNPNSTNVQQESALHCVCKRSDLPAERLFCLEALLSWRGMEINGESEGVSVNAIDSEGNTPLHNAAASGLVNCVDKLLARGAVISLVNRDQLTPCDVAHAANHVELANRLECEMVFEAPSDELGNWLRLDESSTSNAFASPNEQTSLVPAQVLNWLDRQLEEAAKAMNLPTEHAEACLEANDWDLATTVTMYTANPEELLVKAKLRRDDADERPSSDPATCAICADDIRAVPATNFSTHEDDGGTADTLKLGIQLRCGHVFCLECLSANLAVQLKEGVGILRCAGYHCGDRIPLHWLPMMLQSQEDIDKFFANRVRTVVDCSPEFTWCHHAGCEWIIQFEHKQRETQESKAAEHAPVLPCNVLCANAHAYCSLCGEQPHSPCSCELWKEWVQLVQEETSKTGESKGDAQEVADALWISANTKRCPKCTTPIEKNEGCNHMTCRKCRHEFCWICMQAWALHDASTGGFFQCNRFREQATDGDDQDAREELGSAQAETQRIRERAEHMARFIHHYTRWHAHGQSAEMEMAMKESTVTRMQQLILLHTRLRASSRIGAYSGEGKQQDDSIIMDEATVGEIIAGFMELVRSRLVLRGSFAYAFFEFSSARNKSKRRRGLLRRQEKYRLEARREAFERAQSDLEQYVEMLSDVVARKRLRASKIQIQMVTSGTRNTRMAFERMIQRDQQEEAELALVEDYAPRRERSSRRRARQERRTPRQEQYVTPEQRMLRMLLQSLQANGFVDQNLAQSMRDRTEEPALDVEQIPVRERSDDEVSSGSSASEEPDWLTGQFPPSQHPQRTHNVMHASRLAARAEEESALEQAILASFQDMRVRSAEPTPPSPEAVESLQAMGFSEEQSVQALQRTNGDVQAAVNMLLSS